MDYVQWIKLVVKSLANLLVTEFFAKRLESKGTLRCSTNGPYQQQQIDCQQTADVASEPGIQRGHVRKRSDDLQKRLVIDPPASNTNVLIPMFDERRDALQTLRRDQKYRGKGRV